MLTQTNLFTPLRPLTRVMLILAVLLVSVISMLPTPGHAQSGWMPVNGTVTIINNGIGDQVDPHISGNLVTYSSVVGGNSYVRFYDFLTGTDASIPQGNSLDYLSDVNNSTIVYTQVASNSFAINLFDISAGGSAVTLDPQPNSQREKPSIGGQTVAWVDFGLNANNLYISEIVVYDRVTGVTTRLTNDEFYDTDPSVSPDGSFIVWTKCQTYASSCHIWQATNNGNGWNTAPLTDSGEHGNPATDGQYIVYSGYLDNATDVNIFWQTRYGSEVHEIALPGVQRNPAIDGGLVVFENLKGTGWPSNWEALIYDIGSGAGYQVAPTAERPDISVAQDGLVRVVWYQCDGATACDIYASTFRLPETGNQPPVIDQITAPLEPVMVNATISASASFSDPDVADTHTAVWDWGDGNTEPGVVSEANGTGTVSGSHAYATPGVYVVTLTVTDNHDASGTGIFQYVVVYDPSAGFVTGSGWIESPAGAYTPNPSLTGKAHFGFVSRYQKGASLPSGKTEFQFKAGDLSFRSTAYDWLVIAGTKAQFKGTGTINASGDYAFLLTITDGQVSGGGNVDKFRIKIWDRTTGTVIYDNQLGADDTATPSTALGGGSIVIHK